MEQKEPRIMKYPAVLPFKYSAGKAASRFFCELRDNKKIMGAKCSKCGNAYVPPRPVCGQCFEATDEWIECGPRGTLVGYTVVTYPFLDPLTGKERPVPYGYGFILLDGSTTKIQHFLEVAEMEKLKSGLRVEPVFKEEREGNFADIKFFRIVEE